jgi:hypothetical protein
VLRQAVRTAPVPHIRQYAEQVTLVREAKQPAAATAVDRIGRYEWLICALLFFATTINYVDRQMLSVLARYTLSLWFAFTCCHRGLSRRRLSKYAA